jgi:hypothetical protein
VTTYLALSNENHENLKNTTNDDDFKSSLVIIADLLASKILAEYNIIIIFTFFECFFLILQDK